MSIDEYRAALPTECGHGSGSLNVHRRTVLTGSVSGAALSLIPASVLEVDAVRAALFEPYSQRQLLKADLTHLLDYEGRAKRVLGRRPIPISKEGWFASDVVSLETVAEGSRTGSALRVRTLLRNEEYIKKSRDPNGSFTGQAILFAGQPFSAFMVKKLEPAEDWSNFNRISFWCYVHPTKNPINSISLQFVCDGATAGPQDPVTVHYFGDLAVGEWNHLIWEIPEHQRDRVSQIVFFQPLSGVSVADANPEIVYDFDDFAVEKVEAERVDGWTVSENAIAFSHLGYQPDAQKLAYAGPGPANFSLVDAASGAQVANFPARALTNRRGSFSILDFSTFARDGSYKIKYGDLTSAAFPISRSIWRPLIEATLNAFYGFRCGYAVPGAHDACHLDCFVEYKGERRSTGGGWHDAANLTQGPYRTHLSIYALLELREALIRQGETELADRALEEARWGLDWSIKGRFATGFRTLYGTYSYWTDGKVGTDDDVLQGGHGGRGERGEVGRDSYQNTLSALAMARSAQDLRTIDPALAARLLQWAREDYADVISDLLVPTDAPPLEINVPSWRDRIGYITLTATELFRVTGEQNYAQDAARFAKMLIQTQERRFVDNVPITGYWYEDAGRTRLVHEYHNSFEDGPVLALAKLCELLPDHSDWMTWYAGLALYAEAFCARGSEASAPFNVLPAAVWRRADLDAPLPPDQTGKMIAAAGPSPVFPTAPTPELIHGQMRRMFEDGVDLGADQRLRVFPLWSDHIRHGSSTVQLSKTVGLGASAKVMNRADLSELTARQLEWVTGANPLSRSIIYGIGNAFWQNFSVSLPNLVGGMSLGFNSYTDDAPAWGNNAVFPYKEQWVYSSCRLAHNLARIGVPGHLFGSAPQGAGFRNVRTGKITSVRPGQYSIKLAAGEYEASFGNMTRRISVSHSSDRRLDLDPHETIDIRIEPAKTIEGVATLQLILQGSGKHQLQTRTFNCHVEGVPSQANLSAGVVETINITIKSGDPTTAWMLAIIPGGNLQNRAELSGSFTQLRAMT